jgi:hypothetical protein
VGAALVLSAFACGERPRSKESPDGGGLPVSSGYAALDRADLDAYVAGTTAAIARVRDAVQSAEPLAPEAVDSVAAAAAGASLGRFRAVSAAVEAALTGREPRLEAEPHFLERARLLDSLRIELMVLWARARANADRAGSGSSRTAQPRPGR